MTRRQDKVTWAKTRKRIWKRDGGLCQGPYFYLGTFWPNTEDRICLGFDRKMSLKFCHVDHIVPLAFGGSNADTNLRVLCPSCHCLRDDSYHRGMVSKALTRKWLKPGNWSLYTWSEQTLEMVLESLKASSS